VTLYVDSSALAKLYVAEADSDVAERLLMHDHDWLTANHTYVEVMLTLSRRVQEHEVQAAREAFDDEWSRILIVALDDALCRRAAAIGVETSTRTLDALHLAAAERAGTGLDFLTFDLRLAEAARALGFAVLGPPDYSPH
jgi:predicted nucleic acid-binding protein